MRRYAGVVGLVGSVALAMGGCASSPAGGTGASPATTSGGAVADSPTSGVTDAEGVIKIAIQYGMAYAPAQVLIENDLLEKYAPNAKLELVQLGSGAGLNTALASGQVDVGFSGLPPMLVAWDTGLDFKIMLGTSTIPNLLNVSAPDISSFADFGPQDKIAVPSANSSQALLVRLAARDELGDPHALDNNFVGMTHPLAMQALLNHQVAAHFASPPFSFEEAATKEVRTIVTSEELVGKSSFAPIVASADFHENHPELYDAMVKALTDAIEFVAANPAETAEILVAQESGGYSVDQYTEWLSDPGNGWGTTPVGIMTMAEAMHEFGQLSKIPDSWKDLTWPNLHDSDGS